MTTAADDFAVEEAFEAYLAGRPVADEGADVAAFATAVRATATEPGRPNAALAELLATGLLVDQSAPSTRTAPSRRRRRLAMLFPALLAKLLSAGAVAQAATGAGVAVVIVASAGAAGVLPDPVQETFSSIVGTQTTEETTSDESPAGEDSAGDPTDTEGSATDGAGTGTEDPETGDTETYPNFGQRVSDAAQNGGVDGQEVSDWAHERNDQRREQRAGEDTTTPETGGDGTEDVTDGTDGSNGSGGGAEDGDEGTDDTVTTQGANGHGKGQGRP